MQAAAASNPFALPAAPPAWCRAYVGLPWLTRGRGRAGLDCWGLLQLVLAEQAGVRVPDFPGTGYDPDAAPEQRGAARRELAAFMAAHRDGWREVEDGAEQMFDGLLVRYAGAAIHVAVIVADGWALNIDRGCDAVLERWREGAWANKNRIAGIYRHAALV